MGAQMVREVASKTSDIAGDGTTTATVLARRTLLPPRIGAVAPVLGSPSLSRQSLRNGCGCHDRDRGALNRDRGALRPTRFLDRRVELMG